MILYWLPALANWRARIGELERQEAGSAVWDALIDLANHRLDSLQTERLDRALLSFFGDAPPAGLTSRPIRLALLGSSTVSHLLPAIRVAGLRRGLWITTFMVEYGQYRQALTDASSALAAFGPTVCAFALDARHLLAGADPSLNAEGAHSEVERIIGDVRMLWRQARELCGGQIIQQTVLPLFTSLIGQNEHRLPGAPATMAAQLNERLREAAAKDEVDLLAADARAAVDGIDVWHDPLLWHRAKQEIRQAATPFYGELVARLLAAAQGRSGKCLVLDLDDTLWGGVIGDDGLEGVTLGQGSAVGEAFLDFQRYCLAVTKQGVLLAVCSKNDEANVYEMLDHHPEMVLRREHLSAIVANWQDKATNIRAIAQTLNIGLDALIFVDDNPFERAFVRQQLPEVRVPELPDDPALFARAISDAGYFETLAITTEDRARTGQYVANRDRDALLADTTDMAGYLRSLDMQLRWKRFDAVGLKRIVQLVNKTNQFNVTTRQYSHDEIERLMANPEAIGLQFRLVDRFGDNGMIAVVIGRLRTDGLLDLDSWLMSCRVLGRRVEEAALFIIAREAAVLGATGLVGRYRPTAKNAMVADLYPRLGFDACDDGGDEPGTRSFIRGLEISDVDLPFIIEQE